MRRGEAHALAVEDRDGARYVTTGHAMRKDHYISFIAQVTDWGVDIVKLWPEMVAEARFLRQGGIVYAYCNKHGLFQMK